MMKGTIDGLLDELRSDPHRAGVLSDYDGTISPIVDDPDLARPLEGMAEVLGRLARHYRRVAVLSGRPVMFLRDKLPHSLVLSGLYGLEVLQRGRRRDHPSAGA